MKRIALSLVLLWGTQAAADRPSSVAEALRELRHNQSAGARWASFGVGSTRRVRMHTVEGGSAHTDVRIEEIVDRRADAVKTAISDAAGQQPPLDWTYALDADELDGAKAVRVGEDVVVVGGKRLAATVYRIERSYQVLNETRTRSYTFWLAAGAPGGVLKRVTEYKSTDPTYGSREETKLVAVDVPFAVGKQTLSTYCLEAVDKDVDGTVDRVYACFHDSVPGGAVKRDQRITKNGQETLRQEWLLVDYHVERLR